MKIVVAFGGKSLEHDVSVITGMQVISQLKFDFDVYPMYVTKSGEAFINKGLTSPNKVIEYRKKRCDKVTFSFSKGIVVGKRALDAAFVFNCFHGSLGENGSFSGLLNYLKIANSSSDVFGSSISMKKDAQKLLARENSIDILPFFKVKKGEKIDYDNILSLGKGVVVKPNNLGSSIGISLAESRETLEESLSLAFVYDGEALVERKAENFFELNISAMSWDKEIHLSAIEKPKKHNEILSYEDKYLSKSKGSNGMKNLTRELPAKISESMETLIRKHAKTLYEKMDLFGVIRFDFIVEDEVLYFNEANSVPGSLAFYLWEYEGIKFKNLLLKIIDEGIRRKCEKEQFCSRIDTEVLKKR